MVGRNKRGLFTCTAMRRRGDKRTPARAKPLRLASLSRHRRHPNLQFVYSFPPRPLPKHQDAVGPAACPQLLPICSALISIIFHQPLSVRQRLVSSRAQLQRAVTRSRQLPDTNHRDHSLSCFSALNASQIAPLGPISFQTDRNAAQTLKRRPAPHRPQVHRWKSTAQIERRLQCDDSEETQVIRCPA